MPNAQEGVSAFFRKVLDQLSLSAWLPATMFVGCSALLLQLSANADVDVNAAIIELAEKPLGIVVVVLFALILSAIVIQAFSFEVIRILEGYWGTGSGPGALLAACMIGVQLRKLRRLRRRRRKRERLAFRYAREQMLSRGISRTIIDVLEDDVFMRTGAYAAAELATARALGWRRFSTAQQLARLDRLIQRQNEFPDDEHRILPTRLGNVLRSIEDGLDLSDGDLEGFVMRRYDRIPPRLQQHHDQFRTRLDMYCILFFVFCLLAILSSLVVVRTGGALLAYLFPAAFVVLSFTSYSASITSARGYGSALRAIQRGPAE